MTAAVGADIVQIGDVPAVLSGKRVDKTPHAFCFVTNDAINAGLVVIAVDGENRNFAGSCSKGCNIRL